MMDFMDSMKRGVDRAGFEVDRLLRANRVRSHINSLRTEMDEEMRQVGQRVFELCQRGEVVHPELRERCDWIQQRQDEMAARERELETINQEVPESEREDAIAAQATSSTCPGCGAVPPAEAAYCPQCGANLRSAAHHPPTPAEGQPGSIGEQARISIDDDL